MQAQVHDFFSTNSVVTFAGATAIISVLSNTIRMLTKRNPLIVHFPHILRCRFPRGLHSAYID